MSNPTDVTAPDTTPTDTSAADQTAATDATTTPAGGEGGEGAATETGNAPAPDREQVSVAAFTKGMATVTEPKTAADVAAQAADGKPAGTPAAAPAPAAAAPAPAGEPAKKAEPDAETEQAIKDLGLKGRAEERFRELTGQVKEFTPLREALTKHQITDPAQLEQAVESAARAVEWENTVLSSTATPEQFGSALNVIKAMNSDDPKMQNIAFDAMLQTVADLGKRLGREVPGLIDPLADHPDLVEEIEVGDLTRKRALEIARDRATNARNTERDTKQGNDRQHQQALDQAATDIGTLNNQLKAADPDFARKLPLLQPTLDLIRETLHPSKWVEEIAKAYRKLPALPAAAPAPAPAPAPGARVPVSHMPVRASGMPTQMAAKPRNSMEAFKLGLKTVTSD